MDQTSQSRRERLGRKAKNKAKTNLSSLKSHLITTTGLLALAKASGLPIIDSGENVLGLARETPSFADPFNPLDPYHVLETEIPDVDVTQLSTKAVHNMTMMQHYDLFEDAKDLLFTPMSVIDHKITHTLVRPVSDTPTIPKKQRQVRAKVVWKTGEISWANTVA